MHALYLDDERDALKSLRRGLSGYGIKLTCFSEPDALLAIAPSSDADVILLDYDLGDTDGLTKGKNAMRALTRDVAKNGVRSPIKFVEHDGQRYVVDGHHRLRAAKQAGVKEVPVQEVDLPYAGYKTLNDLFP